MEANQFTFGVEIECYIPRELVDDELVVPGGHDGTGRAVTIDGFPPGWKAKRDGSLSADDEDWSGIEFVSPKLTGPEGLRQIKVVCEKLRGWRSKVNRSCGFHVHVGWLGDPKALQRLVSLVSNFEKALFASTGTTTREGNQYCLPIKDRFRNLNFAICESTRSYYDLGNPAGNRYHSLNVSNLVHETQGKRTVEFRLFAGTLNYAKMVAYIRLCVGLVEKAMAMKKTPMWDYKFFSHKNDPSPTVPAEPQAHPPADDEFYRLIGRPARRMSMAAIEATPATPMPANRTGVTDAKRLFAAMGWSKGKSERVFGSILLDGTPGIEQSKKTILRLADKYDRQGLGQPVAHPTEDDGDESPF